MNEPKIKIAVISTSLAGGGAERFSALLGFMLEDQDFEVHNIIIDDKIDYAFTGEMLNLGAVYKNSIGKKIRKGLALCRYLKRQEIQIIIDNRSRLTLLREFFIRSIYGNRKIFYLIQNYKLDNYLPKSVFLAKLLYKNAQKLVCVSEAITQNVSKIYGFDHAVTIHNPFDLSNAVIKNVSGLPQKFVLFFGRIEEQSKNFTLMLQSFFDSRIYEKGYQLVIMGNGPDEALVENLIHKFDIQQYVVRMPYIKDPFSVVSQAKFCILTSHYEGFPLSIIESLAIGIPVVAVDCLSGPAEVIQNEKNGLLVTPNDSKAFAAAMSRFVDDDKLYDICKNNASKSVKQFSVAHIAKKWQRILL